MKVYRVKINQSGVYYIDGKNVWKDYRFVYFTSKEKAKQIFQNAEIEEVELSEKEAEEFYINY